MRRSRWIPSVCCLLGTAFAAGRMCADVIVTADGESISGHEATVAGGVFQVPGDAEGAVRSWNLADLQRVSFGASRPTGELKTRFVRIELPGDNKMLHMAEVQVFVGEENIAQQGTASQSSVWDGETGEWGAQRAIDGNTDGNARTSGTTHTQMESNPWWELDLGRSVTIAKVVVWNRTDDNVSNRLAGFRLVLLDEARQPLWTKAFAEAPTPSIEVAPPARGDAFAEGDIAAFDEIAGRSAAGSVLNTLANWLSGKPSATPAPAVTTVAQPQSQPAGPAFPDGARRFLLADGGQLTGTLSGWTAAGIVIDFSGGGQNHRVTVPADQVREMLSKEAATGAASIDRSQASGELDTVFAKVGDGGALQTVSGTIQGIDGEALQFEFEGRVRRINLNRIAAILRRPSDVRRDTVYSVIEFRGGQTLPGTIESIQEGKARIVTTWNETLEAPRATLKSLVVRNGRVASLADLTPASAEHVPYLDRRLPHTVNRSLNGGTLQIGSKTFDRGLCTHSRTVLTYDLGGDYAQFRSAVGLQAGDGDEGRVDVRVLADGEVLWSQSLAGGGDARDLLLDVQGRKALTLEVDFGEDLDIGDHVVWGDPVLVRPDAR
ncbi:MAG: NPCBM/NEW2 domain-containing protein [Planctomyces sp.]|nr:NPCBM/NEW2 domain-containing protein [Planctomyces sp.]